MVQRALDLGMSACALTDHGTISGAVQFINAAEKAGIKPLVGCELYVCEELDDSRQLDHLPIIALNHRGWLDLMHVVSCSNYPENYYYKPRLTLDQIGSHLSGNIVGISGHLGSHIANAILDENDQVRSDWKNRGIRTAKWFRDFFGKDRFFLEVQLMLSNGNDYHKHLADAIREISQDTGIPCVATSDAHYARPEDAMLQRILLSSNLKKSIAAIQQAGIMSVFFETDALHMCSYEDMLRFGHTEEELSNTNLVADMAEAYSLKRPPQLPEYKCGSRTELQEIERLAKARLASRGLNNSVYLDRLAMELQVIETANLAGYFLICKEIMDYVGDQGWMKQIGRGSVGGCLVAYLLDIIQVDPIKNDLLFFRFYNPGRAQDGRYELPDIDLDVPAEHRDTVVQHISDQYGSENVCNIISFQTMMGRGALKDVFRAFGEVPFEEVNKVTHHIPDKAKIADELKDMEEAGIEPSILRWCFENIPKKMSDWCRMDDNGELVGKYANEFGLAMKLEGTKTAQSRHPAGVVISSSPVIEQCPMALDTKKKQLIAAFEMNDLAEVGLPKFDILGLGFLSKCMATASILSGEDDAGSF